MSVRYRVYRGLTNLDHCQRWQALARRGGLQFNKATKGGSIWLTIERQGCRQSNHFTDLLQDEAANVLGIFSFPGLVRSTRRAKRHRHHGSNCHAGTALSFRYGSASAGWRAIWSIPSKNSVQFGHWASAILA